MSFLRKNISVLSTGMPAAASGDDVSDYKELHAYPNACDMSSDMPFDLGS